jgi:hypothetical protein
MNTNSPSHYIAVSIRSDNQNPPQRRLGPTMAIDRVTTGISPALNLLGRLRKQSPSSLSQPPGTPFGWRSSLRPPGTLGKICYQE